MLLPIHPVNPEPRKIKMVVDCLVQGGVIVYPTDTLYTFGCDYSHQEARNRIAQIKKIKGKKKDFSLVCYDLSHISQYTQPISSSVFRLMKGSLPGPFTFILKANKHVSKIFDYKKTTIGIRVPDNIIARTLVKELGKPLLSTSVHDEEDDMLEYMTDPQQIHARYQDIVDIVIDGGAGTRQASTVVDVSTEEVQIIRQGKGILV